MAYLFEAASNLAPQGSRKGTKTESTKISKLETSFFLQKLIDDENDENDRFTFSKSFFIFWILQNKIVRQNSTSTYWVKLKLNPKVLSFDDDDDDDDDDGEEWPKNFVDKNERTNEWAICLDFLAEIKKKFSLIRWKFQVCSWCYKTFFWRKSRNSRFPPKLKQQG